MVTVAAAQTHPQHKYENKDERFLVAPLKNFEICRHRVGRMFD